MVPSLLSDWFNTITREVELTCNLSEEGLRSGHSKEKNLVNEILWK